LERDTKRDLEDKEIEKSEENSVEAKTWASATEAERLE
jgi:hypothetical protein